MANAAYLSALFALVLTVATGLLCRAILTVMQTPADIFDGAYIYIFIIFMGIPTTFLYNLLAGICLLYTSFALTQAKKVLKFSEGTELMQKLASSIRKGANAYLKRQYTTVRCV